MKTLLVIVATALSFFLLASQKKNAVYSLSIAFLVVMVAVSMILFPEPSFKAAERGLTVWWEIVLPALLPFFIAAELLMKVGVVHFMGVLMEPLMRPLFNVPGAGSFTLAMGVASGYPLGAALSARLKDDGMASRTEAERLICFCNTSDPLFMTGAVAVGMFNRPDLAGAIVGAHYLSALTVGLLLRFWRKRADKSQPIRTEEGFIVKRAFASMRRAQRKQPPFGELLGTSVQRSVNTLLLILGFIVLFSVIFELLKLAGVVGFISEALSSIIPDRIFPKALHESLVSGLFEITIGTSMAAKAEAPLVARVAACSFIIAWSGLSVHAQVAAVVQPSGLSPWPYTVSRFLQAVLAASYTVVLMNHLSPKWSVPTFTPYTIHGPLVFFRSLGAAVYTCALMLAGLALIAAILVTFNWALRGAKKC